MLFSLSVPDGLAKVTSAAAWLRQTASSTAPPAASLLYGVQ
ncbi:hypothetical protein [Streptomyces sp. NPDC005125]